MSSSAGLAADKLPTIVGPTAAGKTALAMWLADRYRAMVISADSRQIYRGFDAGTAKPSSEDRRRVPHRGIDIVDPTDRYSAFAWATAADTWMADARNEGRTPIIVGGTGFYVRALYGRSFEEPELLASRRGHLDRFFASFTIAELRQWCSVLDPSRAHMGRTQLLRAIEVALLSGHRLSVLHVTKQRPARYAGRYLLVDPGRNLGERIDARARTMLSGGWPDEVRRLEATVPADAPAWNSTGYRTIRALVRGQVEQGEALERVVIETRQYAKRQRTWFRHQLPEGDVTIVDPTARDWEQTAERWWSAGAAE